MSEASVAEDRVELRFAVAPITDVEVREPANTEGTTWTMSGYAAVFNKKITLYDSKFLRLTESVDPAFFNNVLRTQPFSAPDGVVHFNFGHDMNRAVAATDVEAGQPGSLQLSVDKNGLRFLAKVPRDDPDGVAMAAKMRSGVLKQASFAFTIAAADYKIEETEDGPDTEHRTLLECRHLYDVCATPQGAYPQTEAGLRNYAAALGQPHDWGGQPREPGTGRAIAASPDKGSGVGQEITPERAAIIAAADEALAKHHELRRHRHRPRKVT
jgi:HK97 family phage prohead protease